MEIISNSEQDQRDLARKYFAEKYCPFIYGMKLRSTLRFYHINQLINFVGSLERIHDIKSVQFTLDTDSGDAGIHIEFFNGDEPLQYRSNYFPNVEAMFDYVDGYIDCLFDTTKGCARLPKAKFYEKKLKMIKEVA
jgi:hypothetical protein